MVINDDKTTASKDEILGLFLSYPRKVRNANVKQWLALYANRMKIQLEDPLRAHIFPRFCTGCICVNDKSSKLIAQLTQLEKIANEDVSRAQSSLGIIAHMLSLLSPMEALFMIYRYMLPQGEGGLSEFNKIFDSCISSNEASAIGDAIITKLVDLCDPDQPPF